MQVNVEKLSPVLVELQINIPADRVRSEVDKAYVALQRTARVRGFRPGKAPRDVLSHIYGGRIHADVAQRLVDETFDQALAEARQQPLSDPAFSPGALKPTEAFSYKARFEVKPDIERVQWEGLPVKRPSTEVTDDMIDAELQRLRREHSTLQAPAEERLPKKGDTVTFSFRLEVEGVEKSSEGQDLDAELGDGNLMKELEDAISTVRPGGEADAEVTFGDRHPNPEYRGKKGTFHLTLKDLRERIFPEIDDELAKDCGEDDLAKLKASVKARVEKEVKNRSDEVISEQLVMELCKANPIPVPPSLVEAQAKATEREFIAAARRMGERFENNADFRARVRADAEMKVRAGIVMAEIARDKQVQVTEEDLEKGYAELAAETGKNVAKVKAEYRDPKKRDQLVGMILEDKILDLIEGAASFDGGA
jgi:trigger factor